MSTYLIDLIITTRHMVEITADTKEEAVRIAQEEFDTWDHTDAIEGDHNYEVSRVVLQDDLMLNTKALALHNQSLIA